MAHVLDLCASCVGNGSVSLLARQSKFELPTLTESHGDSGQLGEDHPGMASRSEDGRFAVRWPTISQAHAVVSAQ